MAKISATELAALDQIAYQISKETFDAATSTKYASDVNWLVRKRIEHFLLVRSQLLQAIMEGVPVADEWMTGMKVP